MAKPESSVYISATVKRAGSKPTLKMQITRLGVAVLACGSPTFVYITGFDIDVNKWLIFAVIAVCCLMTSAYSLKKSVAYTSLFSFSAICVAAAALLKDEYSAGLANIVNKYMAIANSDYRKTPYIMIIEPELAERHTTVFIALSAAFICFCVGFLLNANYSGAYALLFMMCPTMPVFTLGLEPSALSFAVLITSMTAVVTLDLTTTNALTGQQFSRYGLQCTVAASIIAFSCVTFVLLFVEITDYKRPEKLNELFERADAYIDSGELHNDIMGKFSFSDDYIFYGAINHGKLDEFTDIRFKFVDVLQVTMPRSRDTVYLRGYVGSVYTGRSWEELPASKLRELESITENFSNADLSPLLFDSYNLKNAPTLLPNYSFTVKNLSANRDYLYMPYNLVPESVSRYKIVNNSCFEGDSSTYFGQVYDPDSYHGYQNLFRKRWSIPSSLVNDEAAYRRFVYDNYLELPESFSPEEMFNLNYYEYITAEELQTGKSTLDEMTVFSRKLYYIKEWLRDNCNYSLTTKPLGKNEDFVNHFLKHKEGSCSHFASTAVLMCRYAGIPARYVEGYIITPYDTDSSVQYGATVTANVKDSQGHAWAEIYIDGYGWYPMEFTSGYGNVRTAFPTETIASETEPVAESESEITTEITFETNENGEEYTAPQPQETSAVTVITENQEVTGVTVTTTIPAESYEAATSQDTENDKSKSIGFGIFGIQGNKKVDVVYDLTWLCVIVLVILAIPAVIILRRMIIISHNRSAASPAEQVGIDYKRFCKMLTLMGMPEQSGMSYNEYADALAQRSPLLADDNASRIIGFALKASFGGDSISRNEAHEMRTEVTSLAKRYYRTLSSFGKFKFRFIYCII